MIKSNNSVFQQNGLLLFSILFDVIPKL